VNTVEHLRQLVEVQRRIVELSKQLPPDPHSRHCSTSQHGLVYHSPSVLPQPVRRTSAPAACAPDPRTAWIDCRLRSQSLSCTSAASSSSASPTIDIPTCGLDRLKIFSEFVDPAFPTVDESFFLPHPPFQRHI